MKIGTKALKLIGAGLMCHCAAAQADPYVFSTGVVDGRMAALSRPGASETETADDFIITINNHPKPAILTNVRSTQE